MLRRNRTSLSAAMGAKGAMPTLAWACCSSRRASCPRKRGHGTRCTKMKGVLAAAAMAALVAIVAGCGEGEWKKPAATPEPAAEAAQPAPAPPAAPTRVKAEVGVGAKGHDYGEGIVSTPFATYFAAKERIAFNQVLEGMQLYKAMHDGHAPKTHEEFMKVIVNEARINLPTLPPASVTSMIRRTKN